MMVSVIYVQTILLPEKDLYITKHDKASGSICGPERKENMNRHEKEKVETKNKKVPDRIFSLYCMGSSRNIYSAYGTDNTVSVFHNMGGAHDCDVALYAK